ncbi:Crp/Fnr family transcriptional regulator [Sulfurimonas lithotrophica]|uniref:Crp/Fnr family transcriptional regulator n=1 Tax=Sulfurimonas lithotrophica TaxID=2590022 RepID=A0A5P8P254_9BACT|nr:Crp/Fnr family transcriptional regulator [Sulfurimonas lithotrophica]QFR49736.1 Crp/Fnr family transcriptional regulator [Sulfurimonas lithotrophica]
MLQTEIEKKLQYIKNLSFFKTLDDGQIGNILEISIIKEYPKNSILYYENDTKNKVYFLLSGLLKVYKIDKYENEIFLYHIYENHMISELTTIENDTIYCFSNAEFVEDSVILEIDYDKFRNDFLSKGLLNHEFIKEILQKNSQLHCIVNRELVFDATAKVAFMLHDDLKIFNSKKRHEVSFMLHIQPETLSRVLKKLSRNSIIEIENSKVIIKDEKALKRIYMGDIIDG